MPATIAQHLDPAVQNQILDNLEEVLPLFMEQGILYIEHPEISPIYKKRTRATTTNILARYRETLGRLVTEADPRMVPPQTVLDFFQYQADLDKQEQVQTSLSGREMFQDEESFVKDRIQKFGIIYNPNDTVSRDYNGHIHHYSDSKFITELEVDAAKYNRRIPKDEDNKPLVPKLEPKLFSNIIAIHRDNTKMNRITEWARKTAFTTDSGLDDVIHDLLQVYYIDPSRPNITMLKHMLWSIKKKIHGGIVPYPVFNSFQSAKGGLGKTYLVAHLAPRPWMFRGPVKLEDLLSAWNFKAMIRDRFLVDFEELAMGSDHRTDSGALDQGFLATIKQAITATEIHGREFHSKEGAAEAQTAVFASSSQIHIYDLFQDGVGGMRRWWEYHLDPPKDFDLRGKDAGFYKKANIYLNNIDEIYNMIDENLTDGFFHPEAPEWAEIGRIQDGYANQDVSTLFLREKGWELCDPEDDGAEPITTDKFLREFNNWRRRREERQWGQTSLQRQIHAIHFVTPTTTMDRAGKEALVYHTRKIR